MNDTEIEFMKYKLRGAYHWEQISMHPFKSNAFVKGRYLKCIELASLKCSLRNSTVLDLGCGDGALSYLLWKAGARVYGVDSSITAINYAREKHAQFKTNCQFEVAECYETGFNDEYFDCVICTDVIEHVSMPLKLLAEIKRILKLGKYSVISTPIRVTCKPLDKLHVIEWFPEEFMTFINQSFPCSDFYQSHPLFWSEFMSRSLMNRAVINMISVLHNPFVPRSNNWRYSSLQYAIVKK